MQDRIDGAMEGIRRTGGAQVVLVAMEQPCPPRRERVTGMQLGALAQLCRARFCAALSQWEGKVRLRRLILGGRARSVEAVEGSQEHLGIGQRWQHALHFWRHDELAKALPLAAALALAASIQ